MKSFVPVLVLGLLAAGCVEVSKKEVSGIEARVAALEADTLKRAEVDVDLARRIETAQQELAALKTETASLLQASVQNLEKRDETMADRLTKRIEELEGKFERFGPEQVSLKAQVTEFGAKMELATKALEAKVEALKSQAHAAPPAAPTATAPAAPKLLEPPQAPAPEKK